MVVWPDGDELYAEGTCDGEIVRDARGDARVRLRQRVRARGRRWSHVRRDDARREAGDQPSRQGVRCAVPATARRTREARMTTATRHHDLVIIGAGSGNSIPGPEFDDLDIAIVEGGKFGGTCVNVGCIPTKMFVHPADLAAGARAGAPLGVTMSVDDVDWPALHRSGVRSNRPDRRRREGVPRGAGVPEHHRVHRDGEVRRAQASRHRHRDGDHRRSLGTRRREPGDGARRRRAGARTSRPHVRHDHASRRVAALRHHLRRRLRRRRVRPRVRCLRQRGRPGHPRRPPAAHARR